MNDDNTNGLSGPSRLSEPRQIRERDPNSREAIREELNRETEMTLELERDKFDKYATNKSVSQISLNTAVIAQYVGIIINMFTNYNPKIGLAGFDISLIVFLCLSIILQFTIYALLVVLAKTTRDIPNKTCSATTMNITVTILSGLAVIIGIIIVVLSGKVQSGLVSQQQPPPQATLIPANTTR